MRLLQEIWSVLAVSCMVAATTTTLPENSKGYKFGYTVRADETGDYKTHHEVSDGKVVRGSYSVGEPNGDLRVVTYTADRVNGFRALVKVHPGGSPVKQPSEPSTSETDTGVVKSFTEHSSPTTASGDSLNINGKDSTAEVKIEPKVSEDRIKNYTSINYKPTLSKDESVTLFKILPALDKHVPKVEYIVEEVFGDEKEKNGKNENSELRNGEDELFEGSQIIPVKILEDPTNQSLEMVGLDANLDIDYVTTIANEDVVVTNYEEVNKETLITDIQNNTIQSLPVKEPTTQAPQPLELLSTGQRDITKEVITSSPQETSTSTKPALEVKNTQDGVVNKKVQNHLKLEHTSSETQKLTTQHTQDQHKKLTAIPIENMETDKTTSIATQPTMKLATEETKHKHTEIPNKIILAALMFPSVPILKFTCLPDTTHQQVEVKTTPTVPSLTSPTNASPPRLNSLTPNQPLASTVIPLYPFTLLNFKPQKTSEKSPLNSLKLSPQPPLPGYSDFTTIPSTPIVNLRMLSRKPLTGLTTPRQNLDTPKPTQGFSRNVEYTHLANRHHYPLYPIPPPWTYHPLRPFHSHPRHLPIFVLPMSHNANFAPTFNPEAFDVQSH